MNQATVLRREPAGFCGDFPAAVGVLVWSREAFDSRLHLKASLPAIIVDEGKLLHERFPNTTS